MTTVLASCSRLLQNVARLERKYPLLGDKDQWKITVLRTSSTSLAVNLRGNRHSIEMLSPFLDMKNAGVNVSNE